MRFQFQLRSVEEVGAWGGDQTPLCLHWFALTDGWFWIEVGDQELLRYSREILAHWEQVDTESGPCELPYIDYYLARYWEDLLELLPYTLDPLPDDLAARVADTRRWKRWRRAARRWSDKHLQGADWDTYCKAIIWWQNRTWYHGPFLNFPNITIWRAGEMIHISWDNRGNLSDGLPTWESAKGDVTLSIDEFMDAVTSFRDRLMATMAQRVEEVQREWSRPDVEIDIPQLVSEHALRAAGLEGTLTRLPAEAYREYSWEEVRAAIATIDRKWSQPRANRRRKRAKHE